MGGRDQPKPTPWSARPRAALALATRLPARIGAWASTRRVAALSSLLVTVVAAGALVSSSVVSGPGPARTPGAALAHPVPAGGSGTTTTGPTTTTTYPPGSTLGGPAPGTGSRTTSTTGPKSPARHGSGSGHGGLGGTGGGAGGGSGTPGQGGGLWTNLLSATQSLFNGTTASWSGVQSQLAWVASPALSPAGALRFTSTGTQAMWAMSGTPASGGLSPAGPGRGVRR